MIRILTVVLLLFLPQRVFASTWEYITWGGYDAAVNAWNRVALIFSDKGYVALFTSVAILGAIFLFISSYIRIATGVKGSVHSWFTHLILGAMLYSAFIIPKGSLVIYDETFNRGPQQIDNIPEGLVITAGLLNKIERGLVDLISTSSDPAGDYRQNPGGIGFNMFEASPMIDANTQATLFSYIKDCVFMELTREGTQLDLTKIQNGDQTWLDVIRESENPNLYTLNYLASTNGTAQTCTDVGEALISKFSDPDFLNSTVSSFCVQLGFPNTPQGLNKCKTLFSSVLGTTFPQSASAQDINLYFLQAVLAKGTEDVILHTSPATAMRVLATKQTMGAFVGLAAHGNSWLPVIKETLKAVAIALTPLLALALVTPLAGKALSIIVGMFVWVTVWGVVDALLHSFGMDLANQSCSMFNIGSLIPNLGIYQLLMSPTFAQKVAAMFGAIRWAGLMLSSVITAMLIRFGGTALAMLAGSIASMPQSSGIQYGQDASRGFISTISGDVLPTKTWASAAVAAGGFDKLTDGLAKMQAGQMVGQAAVGNRYGVQTIAQAKYGKFSRKYRIQFRNFTFSWRF